MLFVVYGFDFTMLFFVYNSREGFRPEDDVLRLGFQLHDVVRRLGFLYHSILLKVYLISELNFEKDSWIIKVCVIRLWRQPDFKNPAETFSIEMVLVDENGTRIQANVYKSQINDFQHLLQEGSYIYIKDFAIGANSSKYKYCDHPHKLNFIYKTKVTKCSTFNGSVYGFALSSYQSIKSNDIPNNVTVDVIGDVVRCGKMDIDDLKKQPKVQLEMQDLTGVKLNVTLWDEYADKMSDFVSNPSLEGRVIILLQFGRVKWFEERPYISNSYKVSKLFINSEIEEIINFKNRHDDLIGANEIKDIAELIEVQEKKTCIVVGTVKCIPQNEPWYYVACKLCSHKATLEFIEDAPGQVYRCDNCKERVDVELRFRIHLRVQDATGIVSLTLWDRHAKRLMHKSVSELLEMYEQRVMDSIPVELNDLVDRKFMFRVEVTKWNITNNKQVYGISNLTEDKEIITQLEKKSTLNQLAESESFTVGVSETYPHQEPYMKDAISYTGEVATPSNEVDEN